MQSRPVRKRHHEPKFLTKPVFFLRLWFTSTNTYSETVYVNSTQLYKYSNNEKANFSSGSVIKLRVNNEDVSAVILARGSFEDMERLSPQLEEMAALSYETDEVLRSIEKSVDTQKLKHVEKQNADTDSQSGADDDNEISKEKRKLELLKTPRMRGQSAGRSLQSSSSVEPPNLSTLTESTDKATTSQLILVELRVQTTVLKQLSSNMREMAKGLQSLTLGSDRNLPKNDKEFNGYEGPFTLSSISSTNPNVFARNFVRKIHPVEFLHNRILCPLGKTDKQALPEEDHKNLQDALNSWFGPDFSWRTVTLSVNQFLREIKPSHEFRSQPLNP